MTSRFSYLLASVLALCMLFSPVTASVAHAETGSDLNPKEHQELQKLTDLSGGTIQVRFDDKLGTPSFIAGTLSRPLRGEPLDMAYKFLKSVRLLYHFDNPKQSFRLLRLDADELGMKHVRLAHFANNIPVWGDELVVHIDKSGVVRSVNGRVTPNIEKNIERIKEPKINSQQAVKSALTDLKVSATYNKPTARLYYFPYPEPDSVTLTYVVSVRQLTPATTWTVFVDAMNGDVVHKFNDLKAGHF